MTLEHIFGAKYHFEILKNFPKEFTGDGKEY